MCREEKRILEIKCATVEGDDQSKSSKKGQLTSLDSVGEEKEDGDY